MDVGLYTDSLSQLAFEAALDVAADAGVQSIEIAVGGQSRGQHLDVDKLLASAGDRAAFLAAFSSRGLRIAALNCSAWPLHPRTGAFHDAIIKKTLHLASELRVSKVVSMSGSPGDGNDASTINWVWYPWPPDAVQFSQRAWRATVDYWTAKTRLARECGVAQIAFELHPLHLVYNVPTLLRFREEVGDTIGANMDPSHLLWQQMDPIAAVRALGPAVFHVHMKDAQVNREQVAIAGLLDNRPFDVPEERAWVFRTVGRAHDRAWWLEFVRALRDAGYDDSLSIEQEDPYAGQEEGVREAAAYVAGLLST